MRPAWAAACRWSVSVACLLAATAAPWAQAAGPRPQPTTPTGLDSPTLSKMRETGVITLGHRVASLPFSYLDSRRRPIGYSIDICERIVLAIRERLAMPDLEVRMVAVSSATRLPLLANGGIDLECGITTNTAERTKSVSFSVTTFVAASRLLAKKDAGIETLDDLRGKAVATTLSTTSIQYLSAANSARGLGLTILAGTDDVEAFQLVRAGRATAFAMDDVMLRSLLATAHDAEQYSISEVALTTEPYAIGLPHGDPAFKQLVDGVITDLFRRHEIETLYERWFQQPVPPAGINLRLPMNEPLKRAIRQPTDASDPQAYQ